MRRALSISSSSLSAVLLMLMLGSVAGQQSYCYLDGQSFTLPSVGTSSPLTFGQFLGIGSLLNAQRAWQMTLCGASSNAVCNAFGKPQAYIYELSPAGDNCDMALTQMNTQWSTTTATINGASLPAITANFGNAATTRAAVVTIACGGSSSTELTPVNAANNPAPNGTQQPNNGYPGWDVTQSENQVWWWQVVFQTASLPNNMCNGIPTNPPVTSAPVPAGSCVSNEGVPFSIPVTQLTVPQWVPTVPALTKPYTWQLSLCAPAVSFQCSNDPSSFIFELAPNATVCESGLSRQLTNWTRVTGGSYNALFTNTAGDRIANVTLVCGPTRSLTPLMQSEEGWLTEKTTSGSWVWHMWFATSSLPIC